VAYFFGPPCIYFAMNIG